MIDQNQTPLLDAVSAFIETRPAYFRTPGHRLDKGICSRWTDQVGTDIFSYDVTETPLTDDLHQPEGPIRRAQDLLCQLYGADQSFFLINGSTCGNEAMIMSAALEGEKIMIARNAHKSATMGLILSGAEPVYVMPGLIPEWDIPGAITARAVRTCFEAHPDCRALFLVSPSYYGVCSDLKEIAAICHEYGALLLVDEAHGGHFYFHEALPMGALEAGADMCVQSMHKVAGALTQSSVLHIRNHGINEQALAKVAENLHLVQSTSPNYLLMASLDCARYELARNGRQMMEKALALTADARSKIQRIPGFRCMERTAGGAKKMTPMSEKCLLDMTRLVISAKDLGLTGFELDDILFEKYAVNMELSDYENVLAIVTYANEKSDLDRLVGACEDISKLQARNLHKKTIPANTRASNLPDLPQQIMTPRQAYFSQKETVRWQDAVGKISGQMIAPYPPGIPVIYPGEQISQETWKSIECFRRSGRHIHGAGTSGQLNHIEIIKRQKPANIFNRR